MQHIDVDEFLRSQADVGGGLTSMHSKSHRRRSRRLSAAPFRFLFAAVAAGGLLVLPDVPSATAADFWWRGDLGNSWSTTTVSGSVIVNSNFNTGFNTGVDRLALPGTADAVIFAATGAGNLSTVLGAPFSVQSVKLESVLSSAVTIAGTHALTVTASGVSVAGPAALTISAPLVTHSGNYLFNVTNPSASLLISNGLGGANTLTKTGPGLAVLSGSGSFSSSVSITGGTLRYGSVAAMPVGTSVNVVSGNLDIGGFSPTLGSITFGNSIITTPRGLTNSGAFATLTLSGNIDYLGADGSGSPAIVQTRLSLTTGQHLLTNSNAQRSNGPYDMVFTAAVAGTGGLTLVDPTLTVAMTGSASVYTSSTVISGGKLVAGAANALSSQSILNIQAGMVSLAPTVSADGVLAGNYNQTVAGLAGTANGTLHIGAATFAFGNATATTFAGPITGTTGRIVKQGAGTFSFGGALTSTYTGGTTINAGAIRLLSSSALPSDQPVTIAQGNLDLNGFNLTVSDLTFGDTAFSGPKLLSSSVGTATVTLTGSLAYNGSVTASSAVVSVPVVLSAGQRAISNPNAAGGADPYDLILTQRLSGPGGLQLQAAGLDVALAAAGTFTGPTTINGGRLVLAATNALPTTSVVTLSSGTLDLAPTTTHGGVVAGSYSQSITSLSAAAGTTINVGNATFSFGDVNPSQIAATITASSGRLIKRGSGTVAFSGSSEVYVTEISAGTLRLESATALRTFGQVSVVRGALDLAGQSPALSQISFGSPGLPGPRSVFNSGNANAAINLYGGILYQGAADPGLVDVPLILALGTRYIEHTNFSLPHSPTPYAVILAQSVSGPGSLAFLGTSASSQFAIRTNATYTGTTSVTNSTLSAFVTDALPPTTFLRIGAGGALVLAPSGFGLGLVPGNYDQTIGSIEGYADARGIFLGTARLTINLATASSTSSYSGSVHGEGGRLTKLGPGKLILSGTNTYTGPTTVMQGTLQLGDLDTYPNPVIIPSLAGDLVNNASVTLIGYGLMELPGRISGNGTLNVQSLDVRLAPGQPLPHTVGILQLGVSKFDLTDNSLIITSQSESDVRSMVTRWWKDGARNGLGLLSSLATLDQPTTLAVATAADLGLTHYQSIPLSPTDVIVRYTYLGDTDFNGLVDQTDLSNLIRGLRENLTGWRHGDNNYDGVVDADDLANLLFTLRRQGSPFPGTGDPPSNSGPVPEPASFTCLAAGLFLLQRRRHR